MRHFVTDEFKEKWNTVYNNLEVDYYSYKPKSAHFIISANLNGMERLTKEENENTQKSIQKELNNNNFEVGHCRLKNPETNKSEEAYFIVNNNPLMGKAIGRRLDLSVVLFVDDNESRSVIWCY